MSIQWSLVVFTALTGLAGWLYACVALDEFVGKTRQTAFKASLVALITAVVGGLASVTHLAHPEHMLSVFNHPTEGIFLEAVLVGLMCLCGIVYLILVKRESSGGARKAFAAGAGILGIVLSFAAGMSYMMDSIPAWNTFLLPLGYLGSVVPGGVAAYLVMAASQREDETALAFYGKALLGAGIVATVCSAFYLWVATQSQAGIGVCAVLVGGVLPALCGLLVMRKPSQAMRYAVIALVGAFIGAMGLRCAMWLVCDKAIDLFGLTI